MKEKLIQPMKRRFFGLDEIGIARNPTVKDFGDLYWAVQDQKAFSFKLKDVVIFYNAGTRAHSITNLIDLNGISKTQTGEAEAKIDSHIYFETEDSRYSLTFSVMGASRQPVIDEDKGLKGIVRNYFRRKYDKQGINFILAEHNVLVMPEHLINFAKPYSNPDGMTMIKAAAIAKEAIDQKKVSQLEEHLCSIRL